MPSNPSLPKRRHGLNHAASHLRFCLHARGRARLPGYMKWDQIRKLTEDGATIGHQKPIRISIWRGRAEMRCFPISKRQTNGFRRSSASCRNCLRTPMVKLISQQWRRSRKWDSEFAFGQHSGVVHRTSEPYFLPRFPLSEDYGSGSSVSSHRECITASAERHNGPEPCAKTESAPIRIHCGPIHSRLVAAELLPFKARKSSGRITRHTSN